MTVQIDVLTLFPELIASYCAESILSRASERGVWSLRTFDLRDATDDIHRTVDDTPYGGGAGMVLRPDPIVRTVEAVTDLARPLIVLTPSGRPFSQSVAKDLAQLGGFSLLCGRYEGFDQRALDLVADDEVSLGDFVLAGGELAALCVVEAVVRLLPGALGNETSTDEESFEDGLLEYPQFTKPQTYRGRDVPEVLLSGDHARVARWRRAQALRRTIARRPDLLAQRGGLSTDDQKVLDEFPEVRGSSPSG
jgi:tRNA (guanine37-N1)-methyltransferase